MKKIKKLLAIGLVTVIGLSLAACGKSKDSGDDEVVKVGVVGESNEMWTPVIESLKEQGITVKLISFSDYSTPNSALDSGDIDLNAFQHYAYFNKDVEQNGYKLTSIGDTFISAMNIYSNKYKDISEVEKGDKVAIPNDATNGGRALKILEAAGLIELDEKAGDTPEVSNITSNPLNLKLTEVDAANVYALLPDVAIAVINCNYALDNGLNPGEDSIFQDNVSFYSGKSYVNLIAAREKDADNEVYKKVVEAYHSQAVKDVYATTFKGAYLSAWDQQTEEESK